MTPAAPLTRRTLLALSAAVLPGLALPASALGLTGFVQAVAEAASGDAAIAGFYRDRDYAPLWTGEGGAVRREALLRALSQADAHGLPSARYRPEDVVRAFRDARGEREIGKLEVATTKTFLSYAHDIQTGALDPRALMPAEIKRDLPRRDPQAILAGFAASDEPAAYLRALAPQSALYVRLMVEKARLERRIAQGGWGPAVTGGALAPGESGAGVVALRDRLIAMGYLGRSASARYGREIEAAVRAFQHSHGIDPDGVAGAGTLTEINKSAEERLKSVIVALERERWMNYEQGLGRRHVWVNLTDFHARIVDDGKVTFETRAVVGERVATHQTYEFSDEMEYMEVNPDWTVPRSIVKNEYLPRMLRNPNAAGHLQLIDSRGRVVPREAVDFTQFNGRSFPFTLRQPPGRSNALGRVKFMFPNAHAIYLHDTPQKNLFAREVRDFSHGCIRLADPFDFAYTLLRRQMSDPKPYFDGLVNSGRQTKVSLDTHIPVHLVYFTAFAEADGVMQYRRDIYGRDARLFAALEEAGVAFPGAAS